MKIRNLLFATAKLWCLPQLAAGSLCSSPNLVAWKCTYISVHDTPGKKKKNIGLWADHCNVQYKVEKKEYMTIHPRSRHRWTFKKWKWHSEWLVITFFFLELLCLFWKTYWFWIWIKNGRKGKGKHIGKKWIYNWKREKGKTWLYCIYLLFLTPVGTRVLGPCRWRRSAVGAHPFILLASNTHTANISAAANQCFNSQFFPSPSLYI